MVSIFQLDEVRARMNVGPVENQLSQLVDVVWSDQLEIGEFLGEHLGNVDLGRADKRVGRDERSASVVQTFTHHLHPEETFLLLDHLSNVFGHSSGTSIVQ